MKNDFLEKHRQFAFRVKLLILGYFDGSLHFLVEEPKVLGFLRLPNCIMNIDDTFDSVVKRLIHERFRQKDLHWEQVRVDAKVEKTEQGAIISVGIFAAIDYKTYLKESKCNSNACWKKLSDTDKMKADDAALVFQSFQQLKERARFLPLGFYLLGNSFTYYQLQKLFEHVLDEIYDRPNFRRKMRATGLIEPIEEMQNQVQHRPAQHFRFNQEKYELIKKRGFEFRF